MPYIGTQQKFHVLSLAGTSAGFTHPNLSVSLDHLRVEFSQALWAKAGCALDHSKRFVGYWIHPITTGPSWST